MAPTINAVFHDYSMILDVHARAVFRECYYTKPGASTLWGIIATVVYVCMQFLSK